VLVVFRSGFVNNSEAVNQKSSDGLGPETTECRAAMRSTSAHLASRVSVNTAADALDAVVLAVLPGLGNVVEVAAELPYHPGGTRGFAIGLVEKVSGFV
jgi:hypothetical protein